jgi:radical SAM-linked protein
LIIEPREPNKDNNYFQREFINPVEDFGELLLGVEKPGRYTGGEYGILAKKDAAFRALIAFPDLYEIGMVNRALRVIYNRLNRVNGISCDRAFAPAPDFEKLLRDNNIPLYGLDTGINISRLDMLMFTLGYELGLGGILLMLDVSRIPLRRAERTDEHPITIAGGPAVSNPLPYSPFIDAFWIGEAEGGFFDLAAELAQLKTEGQGRAALLNKISSHPNVWVSGKEKAARAIYAGFSADSNADVFPVPSMKTIQHHGTVEIMRGCPNGCRFCHAGFWYRPMRQKSHEVIVSQVEELTEKGGWQEISLSSLSSGDYNGVGVLIEDLNNKFSPFHVSFQMPSLKVSTFSLDLLEKLSVTRKSGLTFAVETPRDAFQMAINKEVTRDSVIAILEEAKKRGWKSAKFYFMIGLPVPSSLPVPASIEKIKTEEEEIVDFIINIGRRTRMNFNINVGIFIPKPNTPYQWAAQIDSAKASEKLNFIRSKLKPFGHKVSVSDTLISQIEGILSRGDERAGFLFEQAYLGGSRLDAWNEYLNKDIWQKLIEENQTTIDSSFLVKGNFYRTITDSHTTQEYLEKEMENSNDCKRTLSCVEKCGSCGVCGKDIKIIKNDNIIVNHINHLVNNNIANKKTDPSINRILFSFSKKNTAVFHGHLSLIEIFSFTFRRAGIPVMYTKGFNPLVKMEFASPLSTGISADFEFAAVDFPDEYSNEFFSEHFIGNMNKYFPEGFRIENAEKFNIPSGAKKYSLSSLLWGFEYLNAEDSSDYVNAAREKFYRQERIKDFPNQRAALFSLKRKEVLARNITGSDSEWTSYFIAYRFLYNN